MNGATEHVSSNKASRALSQCPKGKYLSCLILCWRSAEVLSVGHAEWFEFAPLPELWEQFFFFLKSRIFGRPRKNNRKRRGYERCHASRERARPPRRFCCTDCKSLTVMFDLNFVDSARGYREELCRFILYCTSEQLLLSLVHANTQQEFHPLHSPLTVG